MATKYEIHTVTLEKLHEYFLSLTTPEQEELLGFLPDEDDLTFDSFANYFTSNNNWVHLNSEHFYFESTSSDTITFDPNFTTEYLLSIPTAFADWVMRSYDNCLYDWEQDAWGLGYCNGDDDVDYQGSFLMTAIDIMENYIEHVKYQNK